MSINKHDKNTPFPAKLIKKTLLSQEGSTKRTYHLTLDLTGSDLKYHPGDAIGVYPHNLSSDVDELLLSMHASGSEEVSDPRSLSKMPLRTFLLTKANLSRVTPKLLKMLVPSLAEGDNEKRKHYIETHDVLDVFREHKNSTCSLDELVSAFSPLLPRFYSIASSQSTSNTSVDLLVATFTYEVGGKVKRGVGSHFLCETALLNETEIPIYIQGTSSFTLPSDPHTPILMIGPGTGVAPFRAFLQERQFQKAPGKNWLIFGERSSKHDFYYEDYFKTLKRKEFLSLDTAFSRDQTEKIYVQHRLEEKGESVWKLMEQGGVVYICGDARHMAKDVVAALHRIVEEKGKHSTEEAKAYIKTLRQEKRLKMDVY